jgi:hypothetical protein
MAIVEHPLGTNDVNPPPLRVDRNFLADYGARAPRKDIAKVSSAGNGSADSLLAAVRAKGETWVNKRRGEYIQPMLPRVGAAQNLIKFLTGLGLV